MIDDDEIYIAKAENSLLLKLLAGAPKTCRTLTDLSKSDLIGSIANIARKLQEGLRKQSRLTWWNALKSFALSSRLVHRFYQPVDRAACVRPNHRAQFDESVRIVGLSTFCGLPLRPFAVGFAKDHAKWRLCSDRMSRSCREYGLPVRVSSIRLIVSTRGRCGTVK